MARIVTRHVAVETLPSDLRFGIPDGSFVTVTVEETAPARKRSVAEIIDEIQRLPKTTDDPVERVRKLRDEWSHRER